MPYLLKTVSATRQDFNFIVSFSSNIMETSFSIILQSINLLFESIRQSRKMLQFLYVCVCALNECALTSVRLVSFHRGGHWLQPCADSPVTRLAGISTHSHAHSHIHTQPVRCRAFRSLDAQHLLSYLGSPTARFGNVLIRAFLPD